MKTISRLAAALPLLSAALLAQAQTQPDNQWHGGINLGGALAAGNTSSKVVTGGVDAVKATAADKISLYGVANYARSKEAGVSTTTADLVRAGGRYDYNLSTDIFAFGGGELESNKAGGEKHRYGLNVGAGYWLVRDASTAWDIFGGAGYAGTKFTDGTDASGAQLILGEESTHTLSATTTFKQKLVFYPGAKDLGNRATFDAGLATAISGGWTLNTGLSLVHASKVPDGFKKTDTLLTVGFGYKY